MKNIVVAIEFDEELNDIMEFTTDILQDKQSEAHVVHAYQAYPGLGYSDLVDYAPRYVDLLKSYEDHLQKQVESVRGLISKLTKNGIRSHGYMKPIEKNVANSIIAFSKEKQAELIIIGHHHPSRFERLLLGSIAEEILRHSPIPVAVIPRKKGS